MALACNAQRLTRPCPPGRSSTSSSGTPRRAVPSTCTAGAGSWRTTFQRLPREGLGRRGTHPVTCPKGSYLRLRGPYQGVLRRTGAYSCRPLKPAAAQKHPRRRRNASAFQIGAAVDGEWLCHTICRAKLGRVRALPPAVWRQTCSAAQLLNARSAGIVAARWHAADHSGATASAGKAGPPPGCEATKRATGRCLRQRSNRHGARPLALHHRALRCLATAHASS